MVERTPVTPPPKPTGSWVVVAMIALGIAAGTVAFIYWTKYVTVGEKDKSRPAVFDPEVANKELAQLDDDLAEAKRVRRFNAVLDKAKAFIARYPKYPPAYTLLAKVYIEMYEWPRAYDELQKSLALASNQPMVHHLAGTMQYEMRDFEKAEEHYRAAHVLNPNDPLHIVYIAQVCIRTNRMEEASLKLLEAIALDSRSHEAYATMSDLFMKQNDTTRALQNIEKALDFAATNERAVVVPYILKKAAILRRDDPAAAMQLLENDLQDSEMIDPFVAPDIALTWAALGHPEKAAEFYDKATAANPTEWVLIRGAAEWSVKANDLPAAKRHLRTLEKLDPHLPAIKEVREMIAKAEAQPRGSSEQK